MWFGLFGSEERASIEDRFWKWFVRNEPRLFGFERDRDAVFEGLGVEIRRVDANLTFEFGPISERGTREFVISAGGIRSAFTSVEALFSKAPKLKRWVWVKFRQRRPHILTEVTFGGKTLRADDVHYVLLVKDGQKLGITLFFQGYTDAEKPFFAQFGFLMLDALLGEYAVATDFGYIGFVSQESKYFPSSLPIKELPADFDSYMSEIQK